MKRIFKYLKETIGELNEVLSVMGNTLVIATDVADKFSKLLGTVSLVYLIIQNFK